MPHSSNIRITSSKTMIKRPHRSARLWHQFYVITAWAGQANVVNMFMFYISKIKDPKEIKLLVDKLDGPI